MDSPPTTDDLPVVGGVLHEQVELATADDVMLEAREFVSSLDQWALFPLPLPEQPTLKHHASPRLRQRQARRMQVWRLAVQLVRTINALDRGAVGTWLTSPAAADEVRQVKATAARKLAVQHLIQRSAVLARARRGVSLTGVPTAAAVAMLLKQQLDDDGYLKYSGVRQVPMIADRMVEPAETRSIDMLEVLPLEDREFYGSEENVVDPNGKCEAFFKELETQYGFVGGSETEYLRYLAREDVRHLWEWDLMSNVRAVAGISTVPKKNGVDQRKLVMQVASNYMFSDPTIRAQLGMHGGAALSRCFIGSDKLSVAICDEDSAFTFVRVPKWMTYWQAGPPVLAVSAWPLLPESLRIQILEPSSTYVSPRYLRLAMGGSHSVYILMRINLHHIGQTMLNYTMKVRKQRHILEESDANCRHDGEPGLVPEFEAPDLHDKEWVQRQQMRKEAETGEAGFTVAGWCMAVRAAKQSGERTFVVMHFFAGERRPEDVEAWLTQHCYDENLRLLMISVDLATDNNWDFTIPATYHAIMELVDEGLIDVVIGGPPCSTVSRSRHVYIPGGPRPLRFRHCLWGRPDLKPWEKSRLDESNILWLNYMSVCEGVSSRSGAHLWEHPADPGEDPYPSVWVTDEMLGLERRTSATRAVLHQCPFGGLTPKLTCLSGTLDGLEELDGIRCPGISKDHVHAKSSGRMPDGSFYTRRLQTYPPGLCAALGALILKTLLRFRRDNTGPTGAIQVPDQLPAPRVPAWSTWATQRQCGVVLLNEACVRKQSLQLTPFQSAVYVHVDDTVVLSDATIGPLHCDTLLDELVTGLESVGFGVSQQERDGSATKVVGYEVQKSPACFALPAKKMALLHDALKYVASRSMVQIKVLRALVGVWIFGALLKRELLSIPHSIFHFMETFEGETVPWWKSARDEALAMARVTSLMFCHVGARLSDWLFATDAMGMNEVDMGGYGIVATKLTPEEKEDLLRQGEMEGRTVARLHELGGSKFPERSLRPSVPFTLLPDSFFEPARWILVESGRWRYGDHITLGESRTVVKLLRKLAADPNNHDSTIFSLQDNKPTACGMAKGRSPSFALNRLLRQRAAVCIAAQIRHFLPWVESKRQPADESSRIL